jgi:hypothetical protein
VWLPSDHALIRRKFDGLRQNAFLMWLLRRRKPRVRKNNGWFFKIKHPKISKTWFGASQVDSFSVVKHGLRRISWSHQGRVWSLWWRSFQIGSLICVFLINFFIRWQIRLRQLVTWSAQGWAELMARRRPGCENLCFTQHKQSVLIAPPIDGALNSWFVPQLLSHLNSFIFIQPHLHI